MDSKKSVKEAGACAEVEVEADAAGVEEEVAGVVVVEGLSVEAV